MMDLKKGTMKKKQILLAVSIFFTIGFNLYAQENDLKAHTRLNDTIFSKFNRGEFSGIWQMGTDDWKKKTLSSSDFAGYMRYLKERTGSIISSSFFKAAGNFEYFKWIGEKKTLIVGLSASSAQTFSDINFEIFVSPAELSAIHTDNPLKNAIDSGVNEVAARFMVENSAVGMGIGIIKDGKIRIYNYGTVEKGKNELPTERTLFDLGSTLKTFTGILLAQAVIDKKANLTDDIRKYLPGDYPNLAFQGHPIRLVDLANYTSGIGDTPPYTQNMTVAERRAYAAKYTVADFLEDFHTVKLDFIPGTKYQYSSTAVALLAAILERIYHTSYADLVQRFIAVPMHLKDTRVTTAAETDTDRFAKGYGADGGLRQWTYGPTLELGGIHSTIHDMLLYIAQNIKETNPAVKLSHQQTTHLGIADEESGLGWFIEPTARGIQIEKGGNSPRHSSECMFIREKNIGIICFTNMQGEDLGNLAESVLDKVMAAK